MPKQWNITNLSLQVTSMPIISFEQLAFVAYSVSLLEDLSCAAVLEVVLFLHLANPLSPYLQLL